METVTFWIWSLEKWQFGALIFQILYLKQKFFETGSCLLTLTTSTSHMQSYFKIDLILTKISNV